MLRFARTRAKPTVITLADQARDQRQWERAAGYYQVALRRNPQNPPIWVQYGHVLKESGNLSEAETAYRTALAYDPRNADTHVQLGHALKKQGKKEGARAAYLRAVAIDPLLSNVSFEFSEFGWSEAHLSALRAMLRTEVDPLHSGSSAKGPEARAREVLQRGDQSETGGDYTEWVRLYDTIDDDDRRAIATLIEKMTNRPDDQPTADLDRYARV
jgi:tetratricopeptide (TPR) repeat protein